MRKEMPSLPELSWRHFIRAAVGGGTGLAAWSLLGGQASAATSLTSSPSPASGGAAGLVVPLSTD
jgi:hypothetical protein